MIIRDLGWGREGVSIVGRFYKFQKFDWHIHSARDWVAPQLGGGYPSCTTTDSWQ